MRKLAMFLAAIMTLNLVAPAASVYAAPATVVTETVVEEVTESSEEVETTSVEATSFEAISSEDISVEETEDVVIEETSSEEDTVVETTVEETEKVAEAEIVTEDTTSELKIEEIAISASLVEVNSVSGNTVSENGTVSGNDTVTETPEEDFTWDGTTITKYNGTAEVVVIPEKAQKISSYAFEGNTVITSVVIGKNITSIGYRAFNNCSNLKSVTFKTIKLGRTDGCGSDVFRGCSINKVVFAEGTTYIPNQLFHYAGFESGASIEIPEGVTEIGTEAFYLATNLSEVTFAGNKLTKIGANAFDCTAIQEVDLPDSLQTIGKLAFASTKLQEIVIPSEVTSIGYEAFVNCQNLKSVTFETTKLRRADGCSNEIFQDCSINKVVFAEGTTYIPDNMFDRAGFESGASIEIPEGVTEIGTEAFYFATNLSEVTFAGNKVTKIGAHAFDCTAIQEIDLPDSLQTIEKLAFASTKLQEIVIPSEVTSIGYEAFFNCQNLKSVTFETTKLRRTDGCSNEIFQDCSINKVVFAEGTTYIPDNMFDRAGFESGASIEIPANVTEIGTEAFYFATNLSEVTFAGNKVTKIGAHAFDCTAIQEIDLPDSLQTIEKLAFASTKLQEIVIPSEVTSIGYEAFFNCQNLKSVTFETTKLRRTDGCSNEIFQDCSINKVVFAEGTTYIPDNMFDRAGFESGASIEIPANVTEIGEDAFYFATNLSEVTFAGNKVTKIGAHAFDSIAIETITLPGSLKVISQFAFSGCANLIEVSIPASVTTIEYNAFGYCDNLAKVILPAKVANIHSNAFIKNDYLKIYAPKNSASYKWAKNNGYNVVEVFSITYNLGGGVNATGNPTAYEKGDSLTFNAPTRNGYEFVGWYKDKNFRKPFTYNETMTGNLTLFAKWNVITYSISYETNGGTLAAKSPTSYTAKAAVTLKNPTRTGYTFTGWYTTEELAADSKVVTIKKGSYGDLKLYAGWNVNTYSVKFAPNAKGVTGTQEKIESVSYNEVITLDTCGYQRKGYEFTGWNTKANGKGIAVADGAEISQLSAKNKSTVTLYAIWKVVPYEITYVLNGGTNHKKNPATYNVTKAVTFVNPAKTGYTFKGWYTDAEFTDTSRIKAIKKGNTTPYTVYAKWQENTYSIKFAPNGSGVSGETPENILNLGYDDEKKLAACEYSRRGYNFIGWNTKANGKGIAVADEATISQLSAKNKSTVTLYAIWEAIPYTITYELDGGTNHIKNPDSYIVAKAVKFSNPIKTGYTFKGWYADENFEQKITGIKKGSIDPITVYAKWEVNKYTVKFNANRGTGRMTAQACEYDQTYTLSANTFTRNGYVFVGWNTKANGTGTSYENEQEISNLTSVNKKTITLYAQWEKIKG